MTMITPSYLGETIEYSSLHACRSTLEDPMNPRGAVRARMEYSGDSSVGGVGICADQRVRGAIRRRGFIQNDSTGPRLRQL